MTTNEAKELIENGAAHEEEVDFYERLYEARKVAVKALDEVEKYKKAIEEIKAEIDENIQECQSPLVHDLRWTGRFQAFIESLEIIDKHLKGVKP